MRIQIPEKLSSNTQSSSEKSFKQKGSKNRTKAKQRLAVLHDKITNQRNNFQNKLFFKLISENQAIALETLNVKGMQKNHHLAQAIADSAWGSFINAAINIKKFALTDQNLIGL